MAQPIWEWNYKSKVDGAVQILGNGSFPADSIKDAKEILRKRLDINLADIGKIWLDWYRIGDDEQYLEKLLDDKGINWEHVWINKVRPSLQFRPYINRLIRVVEDHEFGREFLKQFPMTELTPTTKQICQWAKKRGYTLDTISPITLVRGIEFTKAYDARERD